MRGFSGIIEIFRLSRSLGWPRFPQIPGVFRRTKRLGLRRHQLKWAHWQASDFGSPKLRVLQIEAGVFGILGSLWCQCLKGFLLHFSFQIYSSNKRYCLFHFEFELSLLRERATGMPVLADCAWDSVEVINKTLLSQKVRIFGFAWNFLAFCLQFRQ